MHKNPSHYLDVGEMTMALAFALDWTAGDLPQSTIDKATQAIINKGIMPSYDTNKRSNNWWINRLVMGIYNNKYRNRRITLL